MNVIDIGKFGVRIMNRMNDLEAESREDEKKKQSKRFLHSILINHEI